MQDMQPQLAEDQHVAVVEPQVGVGRRTEPIHDHRRGQRLAELAAGGEMVGMGMGVHDITDVDAVLADGAEIMVDQGQFGIDQRRRAGRVASDEIGFASSGGEGLEDHLFAPQRRLRRQSFGCATTRR